MGWGRNGALAASAVAALYFTAVALFFNQRSAFQLNPDEGINVIKSLLVARGYRLYTDIWSDQPPLFTYMLWAWFDLVGWDVERARLLVLLFASLIVFGVYDLVRLSWSHRAALAAVLVLATSTDFMTLSVSVMIGLPSLACALLAAWGLVRWERTHKPRWLASSAALMGLSLCIKLFTAFLVPTLALWLGAVGWWRGHTRPWRPAVLWLISVGVAAVLLIVLAGREGIEQLVGPHVAGRATLERYNLLRLSPFLLQDWPLILLAFLGAFVILRARCWELSLLLVWAAAAFVALVSHAPVWLHHCQLLIVVGSASAGVAVDAALRMPGRGNAADRRALPPVLQVAAALAIVALVLPRWPMIGERSQVISAEEAAPTLAALSQFAPYTRMIVTDTPMYAFRIGLAVAPELAVVSMKRLKTGNLNAATFSKAIRARAPEQILLTRLPPRVHQKIARSIDVHRYHLAFNTTGIAPVDLWVRADIVEQAATATAASAAP